MYKLYIKSNQHLRNVERETTMNDYNILNPVKWAIGRLVAGAGAYIFRDYLFFDHTKFSALELLAWSGIGSGIGALRAAVARDRICLFDDTTNDNGTKTKDNQSKYSEEK